MHPAWAAPEVVRRLGGTAEWRHLLRHTTSHAIRQALAAGELHRVARGTYALPTLPPAAAAAAAVRGIVSHSSAAAHWKLELLVPDRTAHVTVPRRTSPRRRRGVRFHYRDWEGAETHGGVTSPVRTVLDCAATLPFPEALAVADSALRKDLVSTDDLVKGVESWSGQGRARLQRVVALADAAAANPFESALRATVLDAGLTGFRPQVTVRTPELTARLDLADTRLRVALEADSFAFHGTRAALDRDCRRYDELVRCGWLVLRFSWEQVMFDAGWVGRAAVDTCLLRNPVRQAARRRSRDRRGGPVAVPGCDQ